MSDPGETDNEPVVGPDPGSSQTSGRNEGERRLHPVTIPIEVIRFARNFGVPLLAVRYFFNDESALPRWFWIALFAGTLALLQQFVRFFTLRYQITSTHFHLREGLLFRRQRTIPLERIQNVHQKSPLVARILRGVEVRIETAAPGEADAKLSVLSVRGAAELRAELLGFQGAHVPGGSIDDGWSPVHRTPAADLFLAGATETRVGMIVAGLLALLELTDSFGETISTTIAETVSGVSDKTGTPALLVVLVGVFLLFVLGWILSIGVSIITWRGFALDRSGERLRTTHGLVTRYEALLPLARIQSLRLEANWLRRFFGLLAVRADTAGSAKDHESAGTALLAPLLRTRDVPEFVTSIYPVLPRGGVPLRRVPKLAFRRAFLRSTFAGILILLAAALLSERDLRLVAPFVLVFAFILARLRYRALGYAEFGAFLLARRGVWTERLWIVPKDRIQEMILERGPLQRCFGLATLSLAIAGGNALARIRVVDLALKEALRLQKSLASAITDAAEV